MPNRVVRGELLNSERYWTVGLDGRQFFVHLILVADDFGLVNGTSFWLRRNCFGPDGCDPKRLESLLTEVCDAGLVIAYAVRDVRYLWIPRFGNVPRATRSRVPVALCIFKELANELRCVCHGDDMHVHRIRPAPALETESGTETDREEGTRREAPPLRRVGKGTRLPEGWRPTAELMTWARSERPDLDLERTIAGFCDYWQARPGRDATKLDWGKTFRNWLRNERMSRDSISSSNQAVAEWRGAL